MRHALSMLLLLLVAGCMSTPRPFQHDSQDDQAYRPKDDNPEVSIAPPVNMPPAMARRVAAALAIELQAYGIVATVAPGDAPAQATGVMSTRDSPGGFGIEVDVDWSVTNAKGKQGPLITKTSTRPEDYGAATDRLVSRIAQQGAPQIATLLGHPPDYEARSLGQVAAGLSVPPAGSPADAEAAAKAAAAAQSNAQAAPQVRVMVGSITGAPSDGNRQLSSGMRRALGSSKVIVMDKPGDDVFTVSATVTLSPINDQAVQLAFVWILKDPKGRELGKVEQSNPVSISATRGTWAGFGDIVAAAAVDGIIELLDRYLAARGSTQSR